MDVNGYEMMWIPPIDESEKTPSGDSELTQWESDLNTRVYIWNNPTFLQADYDLMETESTAKTYSFDVMDEPDGVKLFVPMVINRVTIINALNELNDKIGTIEPKNSSRWSDGFWNILRKLKAYDAIWIEQEREADPKNVPENYSNHAAEIASEIVDVMIDMGHSFDHATPYMEIENLCVKFGLKDRLRDYRAKIYGEEISDAKWDTEWKKIKERNY